MDKLKFNSAYYIKLGKKGKWADESIAEGIVRVSWQGISLNDINNGNWDIVKALIKKEFDGNDKKNGSTQDSNALKNFCAATEEDAFITFHKGKMYWCTLDDSPVEEDDTSKFRKTKNGWSCHPINDSGILVMR